MRRITLVGNCQVQALCDLYQRFVAPGTGDILHFIQPANGTPEQDRAALRDCDLIVEQLCDDEPAPLILNEAVSAPRLLVPLIGGEFLWPFSGPPHPHNPTPDFMISGPYGGESSDGFLNGMIRQGIAPEEAVEAYLKLDIAAHARLDEVYQRVMDGLRARDRRADYALAPVIERHFREERVFLSPHHPDLRLSLELAARFFQQMGASQADIDRMRATLQVTPFPKSELPIHPGVIRHFGLSFVTADRRHRFLNEGFFTFREFALRYMRLDWNPALEEGLELLRTGDLTAARDKLAIGVRLSPLSAPGHKALCHLLVREGRLADALVEAEQALEIEPDLADNHAEVGNLHRLLGHLAESERAFRAAIALNPVDPHARILLTHVLRAQGCAGEAVDIIRPAVELDPGAAHLQAELGHLLDLTGDLAAAEQAFRRAIALAPENGHFHHQLSHALHRLGRLPEAVAIAETAVRLAPSQPHLHAYLGHLGVVRNELPAAEAAYRAAVALAPHEAGLRIALSDVLARQDRLDDAAGEARVAVTVAPFNAHAYRILGSLLLRMGHAGAAEDALWHAFDLEPNDTYLRQLFDMLARLTAPAEPAVV